MADLNQIPTESLLDELQRRINSFITRTRQLLGSVPGMDEPKQGIEQLANWEEAEPGPTQDTREEAGEPSTIPTPIPTKPAWATNYTHAQEAGLGVPNRDPNRALPAHVLTPRELPKLMDPAAKASMWAAVDRSMETDLPAALRDAEETGDADQAEYLRSLPGIRRAQSSMAPPSIGQIVAINKRNAQDAFIQPILPPSLKNSVQAPIITQIGWYDDPPVVYLNLADIVINKAPLRTGIPPVPPYEIEARTKSLAKLLKTTLPILMADGFTGHLPRPVAKLQGPDDLVLQLLLEPVVIWRLLLYVGPKLPYVHYVANLMSALNECVDSKVDPSERVTVTGNAESAADMFRDRVTRMLTDRFSSATDPKVCQAIKRQIRIMNVDMQERAIPDERTADRMRIDDPRKLADWDEGSIGTTIGRGHAQLNPLPGPGPSGDDPGYHEAVEGDSNGHHD